MLAAGPRSTYPFSSGVQPGSRDLAREILRQIDSANARQNEVRIGLMTTGCDGVPVINPLDGTSCAGDGGTKVLYHPQTMTVLGTISKPAAAGPKVTTVHPAACTVVRASLKARRRFVDDIGNMYGPSGLWMSGGNAPATLETDYVHRKTKGFTGRDDTAWTFLRDRLYLDKTVGAPSSLLFTADAQGTVWPSVNDIVTTEIKLNGFFQHGGTWPEFSHPDGIGLNDVTMSGSFGLNRYFVFVRITSVGVPDIFEWKIVEGTSNLPVQIAGATGVPILGSSQPLSADISVLFRSPTGHTIDDAWHWSSLPNNNIVRRGVAARGQIATATPCISVNSNLLVTAECSCDFPAVTSFDGGSPLGLDGVLAALPVPSSLGSHALVVRDADTLAPLYRKALTDDTTPLAWGDPPQKFSFSSNDEGLFFMHCYTVPVLTSPPTPYPGAEFGSPDPRKVAVISVNPITFEPTIDELITLEDRPPYTTGATFAVTQTI